MERRECGEECGIAAVYLKNSSRKTNLVPELLYVMLSQLQHRGQLSAGISTYNPFNRGYEKKLKIWKGVGRVNDLFRINDREERRRVVEYCKGIAGIGHVRYATAGCATTYLDLIEEAQPFLRHHGRPWKRFSIAFNGNLANYFSLRKGILKEGYLLDTKVDTEIIMHLIALNLKALSSNSREGDVKPNLFDVAEAVMKKLDGAYNVLELFGDGDLVVIRDPLAFKPLVFGENSDFFGMASESVALEKIGIEKFYPVSNGSCMIFNRNGMSQKNIFSGTRKAHCHFERVYFSRANSIIDGKSVNSTRENLGKNLARIEPLKDRFPQQYVVVPIPNTAIPAAETYARTLNLPLSLALIKGEGERGFINKEEERKRIMDREYGLIVERVKGKKIILIEDSIVRGETSRRIVSLMRNAGALEVHLRSTEPPLLYPCFYGIDFPTYKELIAARNLNSEDLEKAVASEIGADSVVYQTLDGLIEATGFSENELCLACLTGDYPTEWGKRMAKKADKAK